MPNHIKNRIIIVGADDKVKEFIEKFTTSYDKKPYVIHDGTLLYKGKGEATAWLNEETNEFTIRETYGGNFTKHVGIQEGYELQYVEAWTRFPDFNKVIPMPDGMDIQIHSGIETAVKKYFNMGYSDNPLLASLEKSTRMNAKNRSDFDEKEQLLFDQAVKNYQEHGSIYWYDWCNDNWGTKWNAYSCEKVDENTFIFETAWSGVPNMIEAMSLQFPDVAIEYAWSDEDTGSNCGKAAYKNGEIDYEELENGSKEAYELAFELRPHYRENYKLIDDNYEYNEED